jgi:antitoxin VapB
MPLYIKDDEVDALASELQSLSGAATKTEAVRTALKDAIKRKRARKTSILKAIRQAQARAAAMGVRPGSDFDMKEFMDDLSGGI